MYFQRYFKLPDLSESDWFESLDELTEEIKKIIKQQSSLLKAMNSLDRLIHWENGEKVEVARQAWD